MKIFRSGRRLPVVQIFIKICLFLRTESNGNLFDWELWLALLQLLWVVMILCWSPGEPRWQHQPTGHYSFSDRHCCYFSSPAQLVPSHCSTWVAISCNISISYKQIINIPLLHLPFPPSPPSLSPALVRSDPWRESTNWRICHDSDHNPGHWEERRLLSMFLCYRIMSSAHLFMEMEIKLKEWRVHPSDDDTFNGSSLSPRLSSSIQWWSFQTKPGVIAANKHAGQFIMVMTHWAADSQWLSDHTKPANIIQTSFQAHRTIPHSKRQTLSLCLIN